MEGLITPDIVHFMSDGLELDPLQYTTLLKDLVESSTISLDKLEDAYCRGGAVAMLECQMSKALGKEAAIYLPTGTLANHLALRQLTSRGKRVIVQHESHLYNDSGDCTQLSGLTLIPQAKREATFRLQDVVSEWERADKGKVAVGVGAISIESPLRRLDGRVFDFEEMRAISTWARTQHVGMHLDGARLFLAPVYTGISVKEYAGLFDTVYVSLYKYFNAHAGAILAGPGSLIENLYHQRRMFGGSPYQSWTNALIALHYMDGFAQRFDEAAQRMGILLKRLSEHPHCLLLPTSGSTNVAILWLKGTSAVVLRERLYKSRIAIPEPLDTTNDSAIYKLVTNESLLRKPIDWVVDQFIAALK